MSLALTQASGGYATPMSTASPLAALPDSRENLRIFVLAFACLAASVLCWSILWVGPVLSPAIALIPLMLPWLVAYLSMRERGVVDPATLFPAIFGAYTGIPLLRFLSEETRQHLSYPLQFESDDFFRAGLVCALAAIFVALASAVWRPSMGKRIAGPQKRYWFNVGIIFYLVGVLIYLLQYSHIGGYWTALSIERTKRFELIAQNISFPYYGFVVVGLVMSTVSTTSIKRWKVTIGLLALWCLMVTLQGDRRLLVQTVLAVMAAKVFVSMRRVAIRPKHILLAIAVYIALSIVGQLREQIPEFIFSSNSHHVIAEPNSSKSLWDVVLPGNSELGGPFFSILYNGKYVKDYALGATYAQTIITILPRFIYSSKPPSPSTELDQAVNRGAMFGFAAAGWGYSPLAEAFLNFGIPGVCIVSFFWMLAFIALGHLRKFKWGLVIAAVLTPETVNANRIDFRTVYLEAVSCLLVLALAGLTIKCLSNAHVFRNLIVARKSTIEICVLEQNALPQ